MRAHTRQRTDGRKFFILQRQKFLISAQHGTTFFGKHTERGEEVFAKKRRKVGSLLPKNIWRGESSRACIRRLLTAHNMWGGDNILQINFTLCQYYLITFIHRNVVLF